MSVLDRAIGWVAPPLCVVCASEGSALCKLCIEAEIVPYGPTCWNCGARSPGGRSCQRCCLLGTPSYVWLSTIYENAASELLKTYKFGQLRAAADTLSEMMADTLLDFFDKPTLKAADYLVVPVPTATSRARRRSFDHSTLLARKIASKLELKYLPALGRLGQTRQVGTNRAERLSQSQGKYFVRLPNLVAGRRILLIDDVVTTGGTLRSATKALRAAGVRRVDALAFAKRL